MKQQVNLYLPEFRPRQELVSAARLLQVLIAVMVLMAALAGLQSVQKLRINTELTELQAVLATRTRQTEELERRVADNTTDQALQREISSRETRLSQSRELLDFLNTTKVGNVAGFSEPLKDLSRASFSGLWFTDIRFEDGGSYVYLEGDALQSAMVPDYIARLSLGQSSLKTRQFSRVHGSRMAVEDSPAGQAEHYRFVMETRR